MEKLRKSSRIDPKSASEAEEMTEKASKSAEDPYGASVPPGKVVSKSYPPDLAPLTPSAPHDPEEAS
jgi:hypothetical protein